jgi:transcriptional regulator with XRE-family HTH domain
MPQKRGRDPQQSFGKRLAELRKAAGHTQQQLAEEVGVSRRMIAFYETETGHPPTSFLIELARALNVTTDQLLGLEPPRGRAERSLLSSRLERRLRQVESLAPKPKQQILAFIDTVVAAESMRKRASGE